MSGDRGSKQDRGKVRRAAETRSRARRKAKSTPEDLGPERRLQLARQIGKAGPRKAAFDLTGRWRSAQRESAVARRADNPPARCRHRCEPSPSARILPEPLARTFGEASEASWRRVRRRPCIVAAGAASQRPTNGTPAAAATARRRDGKAGRAHRDRARPRTPRGGRLRLCRPYRQQVFSHAEGSGPHQPPAREAAEDRRMAGDTPGSSRPGWRRDRARP